SSGCPAISAGGLRSILTTLSPRRRSSAAMARPMPPLPPVRATFIARPFRVDGLAETADVADGVEPSERRVAGVVVAVAFDGRHMVGAEHAVEADVAIGAHAGKHVGLAGVVPGLLEALRLGLHVAEMDEKDLLGEAADDARQVIGHQREVAL